MQVMWPRFVARLIVSAFLAGVAVSPCRAGPQDMLTLMQRITALAREGRYSEAVTLARSSKAKLREHRGDSLP